MYGCGRSDSRNYPFCLHQTKDGEYIIAHPAGSIGVQVEVTIEEGSIEVKKAAFGRTARRIMDGYVYIKTNNISG